MAEWQDETLGPARHPLLPSWCCRELLSMASRGLVAWPGNGDEHGPQHMATPTPYTLVVPCPHLGCPLAITACHPPAQLPRRSIEPTPVKSLGDLTPSPPATWLHVHKTAHASSSLSS